MRSILAVAAAASLALVPLAIPPASQASGPILVVSPAGHAFSPQRVGTASSATTFQVTNNTVQVRTISSATVTDSQFIKVADTCSGSPLAAQQSCTVSVSFTPTSTGDKAADLMLLAPDGNNSFAVALTGTGTAPAVSVDPTSSAWGPQVVGTTSETTDLQVTNTGTASLTITDAALHGTDLDQFTEVSDTCTDATLAPGTSCVVRLRFAPTSVGAKSADVRFTHDVGVGFTDVPVSGTAVAPVDPGDTNPVEPGMSKHQIQPSIKGKNLRHGVDRVVVRAKEADGAKVKLFRLVGNHRRVLVKVGRMNERGVVRFKVRDHNDLKTKYLAVVRPTKDTKRGVTQRLRLRRTGH